MHPLISVSESIHIPSYMLVISLTYCFCLFLIFKKALQLGEEKLNTTLDLCLLIMVGGLFGARLFHVLYEKPNFYFQDPIAILKVWKGGFVYYGGFIGAFLATWAYIKIKKLSFFEWGDFFAPYIALGYALGRWACHFNGCCYGELCEWPWAVEFHSQGLPTGLRHPTAIYASFLEFFNLFVLFLLIRQRSLTFVGDQKQGATVLLYKIKFLIKKLIQKWSLQTGSVFLTWLFFHGCNRLIMEHFRADDRGPLIAGLSVSSALSLILIFSSIVLSVALLNYTQSRTEHPR